jgi:hypothetical protein
LKKGDGTRKVQSVCEGKTVPPNHASVEIEET